MLHIYGATDRGMVREANEDRFAGEVFDRGSGYAVVCDGMGGEAGGGIAAGIAAEEVRRMIESSLRTFFPGGLYPQPAKRRSPERDGQYAVCCSDL